MPSSSFRFRAQLVPAMLFLSIPTYISHNYPLAPSCTLDHMFTSPFLLLSFHYGPYDDSGLPSLSRKRGHNPRRYQVAVLIRPP